MKLYELNWALYPRGLGIYLVEKGIEGVNRHTFNTRRFKMFEKNRQTFL
jgi:hypothetical protein